MLFRERPHPRARGIGQNNRPRLGDTVVYNMQKYQVTLAGLKYLHIKHEKTGLILSVRIQDVVKWFPSQEPPLLENMRP